MFGIYKKLKDAAKKASSWLKKYIPKAREVINYAKPIATTLLNEVPKIMPTKPKVRNFLETTNDALDLADSGLELSDDVINKRKSLNDGINWVNYNISPRLKH